MCLVIHLSDFRLLLFFSSYRIQDIFSALTTNSRDAKFELIFFGFCWPVIVPLVGLTQRLSDLRRILLLFDIVEFVSKAIQILSLDHLVHMV